jgi:hypothetical protein
MRLRRWTAPAGHVGFDLLTRIADPDWADLPVVVHRTRASAVEDVQLGRWRAASRSRASNLLAAGQASLFLHRVIAVPVERQLMLERLQARR